MGLESRVRGEKKGERNAYKYRELVALESDLNGSLRLMALGGSKQRGRGSIIIPSTALV